MYQCLAFKAGNISGTLCSDLCERNNIQLGNCLSTVPEKKIYDGDWKGKQVVLKVNMSWFEETKKRQDITDNDAVVSYRRDISSRVRTLFGDCCGCSELTSLLVSLGDGDSDGTVTGSEARTFVSLLQHIEPVMLMALNESKHTVDFYGYCGGLYLVEKVPYVASKVFADTWELLDLSFLPDAFEPVQNTINSVGGYILNTVIFSLRRINISLQNTLSWAEFPTFSAILPFWVPSKSEKFQVAYSMLDAILDLSNHPYGLVQSCDAHLGNFGFTNSLLVKTIDLDLAYPHVFLRTLLEQKNCTLDTDCWTGNSEACSSTCNTSAGTCTSLMNYQDLHVVCEILFATIFGSCNSLVCNTTCVRKAIGKLGLFCSELPVVYSVQELKLNILAVRTKLKSIELSTTESC